MVMASGPVCARAELFTRNSPYLADLDWFVQRRE